MTTLGVDTSNYATSLAVVDTDRREVLYSDKRFLPVGQGQLGLRQSDAVFEHMRTFPLMLETLANQFNVQSIQAVGVSEKPRPAADSYMPCFLAGTGYASTFSIARKIPLIKTTHQQGHVAAALFGAGRFWRNAERMLVFHISGGTTELLLASGYQIEALVGGTLDLYAGQAVDRLGTKLGFSFPAGASLSALAGECNEDIRPKISVRGTNCHLSGLQNQCESLIEKGYAKAYVARYCLLAIADTIVAMVAAARESVGDLPILCAGGVLSSDVIRERVTAQVADIDFVAAEYAGDNAIGVALIAAEEAYNG